jgi:hypothetical protein
MRMLIDGADNQTGVDPSLLRIIALAHDIPGRLNQNTELTVHYVAPEGRVAATYIYALLLLPWRAPDITTAIINGHGALADGMRCASVIRILMRSSRSQQLLQRGDRSLRR